jgi:hypothetical protein
VQLDPEAGVEGTVDHPLAMHFQDARAGEAAHQRLAHLGRIGAGLGGEHQRLGHGLDIERHDDLVRDLGGLPVAVAADQGDVLAHQLEQRLDLVECGLRAADHDRQRAGLGTDLAARDRRIQIVAAQLVDLLGELLGRDRRDRAHVDHGLAGREPGGDAALGE